MRGARVAALVIVSFSAVVLFLLAVLPDVGGVCNTAGTSCTAFSLPGVVEVALFGVACAGIGLLAAWRKPGR